MRAERALERKGREDRRGDAVESLRALARGDVIAIPIGRHSGVAVVLVPDNDPKDPRPLVLTADQWARRLSSGDFPEAADVLGKMRLPKHVDHHTARIRRDLASALRSTGISAPGERSAARRAHPKMPRSLLATCYSPASVP